MENVEAAPTPAAEAAPAPMIVVEKAAPEQPKGTYARTLNYVVPEPDETVVPETEAVAEEVVDAAETGELELVDAPEPAPEAKPEKALKLKEFRSDTGHLDEAKLEPALQAGNKAQAAWKDINELVARNPELELAILRVMKAEGRPLSPEAEARLASAAVTAPPPAVVVKSAAKVVMTKEQIKIHRAEYARLVESDEGAATDYWHENVVGPYARAEADAVYEARTAKDAEVRRVAEDKANALKTQQAGVQRTKDQLKECAKAYPTLFKLDETQKYGGYIADKALDTEMAKLRASMDGTLSLKEIADMALFRLGRVKPKAAAAPAQRAPTPQPTAFNAAVRKAVAGPAGTFQRTIMHRQG